MKELEMVKAIAKLEGVEIFVSDRNVTCYKPRSGVICAMIHTPYNPITDLALNCSLRDKYEVSVNWFSQFDCGIDGSGDYEIPFVVASTGGFDDANTSLNNVSSGAICSAVIECILKSQGLWK